MLRIDFHLILNQKCHLVVNVCLWIFFFFQYKCPAEQAAWLWFRSTHFFLWQDANPCDQFGQLSCQAVWCRNKCIKLPQVKSVSLSLNSSTLPPSLCFSTVTLLLLPTIFYCPFLVAFSQPQSVHKIHTFCCKNVFCCIFHVKSKTMNTWIVAEREKPEVQAKWRCQSEAQGKTDGGLYAAPCWLHNGSSVLGRQCQN